jgi:PknH-like extracellular domain
MTVKRGVVLLIAAVLATACGGPAPRADSPPAVDQLAAMLADESGVNAVMGTTTLQNYYRYRALPGWPQGEVYSRPECLAVTANAMEAGYAGSHYVQMRGARLDDADRAAQRNVDEAVVAFETPAAAQAFVAATVRAWKPCANAVLTITAPDKPLRRWNMGSSRVVDGVDVVDADQSDSASGWRSSHAMRASNNVVIDVRVTGYRITDQAVRLVNAIAGRNRL